MRYFGTYSIYTYGMYTYGMYIYGMYTYDMYTYGLYTYCLYRYVCFWRILFLLLIASFRIGVPSILFLTVGQNNFGNKIPFLNCYICLP